VYSNKTMLQLLNSWRLGTMDLDEYREMCARFARAGLDAPVEKVSLDVEGPDLAAYAAQSLQDREEMRQELLRTRSELSAALTNLRIRESEVLTAQNELGEAQKENRTLKRAASLHSSFRAKPCEILKNDGHYTDAYLRELVQAEVSRG